VPQQIGAALKHESFYTQAISTDAAVINFGALPIARPAGATFAYGFLAGRTQDAIPDEANEVFASARANGKVYIAYGSIDSKVQVPACNTMRTDYNKRAESADEKLRLNQIDKNAPEKRGDLRQQGEDAFRRCFTEQAPRQARCSQAGSGAARDGDGTVSVTPQAISIRQWFALPRARKIEIRQSRQRDARCPVVARKIFRLTRRANQR